MWMRPAAVVPTGSIAFFIIVLFYRTKTGLHPPHFFHTCIFAECVLK